MKTKSLIELISALLILLFVYTAVSKLMNVAEFRRQMQNQSLPPAIEKSLVYVLPAVEIITALLLLRPAARFAGLVFSAILMSIFSGYILLVLLHFFPRVPCSCGGVLKSLGWNAHLVFNLFFLLLNILAIVLYRRERRVAG